MRSKRMSFFTCNRPLTSVDRTLFNMASRADIATVGSADFVDRTYRR